MNAPSPTDWHRRPAGFRGPCPICGYTRKHPVEHRAVDPAEGLLCRWLGRSKGPGGWQYTESPKPRASGRAAKPRGKHVRVTTRENISLAARMIARGSTFAATATSLGVSVEAVQQWRRRHPKLWAHDFRREIEQLEAEEPAPVDTVDQVRLAINSRRLTGPLRVPAPPADLDNKRGMALRDFLHSVYLPGRLGISRGASHQYDIAVACFDRWAGRSTVLADLTRENLLGFLAWYLDQVRPSTVNAKRTHLLALAREAVDLGYLDELPRKVPRAAVALDDPESWSVQEVGRILAEAAKVSGKVDGIPAALWWVSLLLVLYDTGARIGAVLAVRPEDVDLEDGRVLLRPSTQKTKRGRWCPLAPQTADLCRKLWRPGRRLMWPWPCSREWLEESFRRILRPAGVPFGRSRGGLFHKLRRTSGSLVEAAGGDGSRHLGNSRAVFETHYLDPKLARRRMVALLPRPTVQT